MPHLNIEIKAKCSDATHIRKILKEHKADYKGTDHQIDTYFEVPVGRLKLRQGNIENNLIHYQRENQSGPKQSIISLYTTSDAKSLLHTLTQALPLKVVVDKHREIYFIDNVKFHIDQVKGLGSFVEIEAIDYDGTIGKAKLLEQCQNYLDLFGITEDDLLSNSYSDILLEQS